MLRSSGGAGRVLAACAALLCWSCATPAAPPLPLVPRAQVDLAELTQATQRQVQKDDRTAMVWWLPEQFWDEALRRQKSSELVIATRRDVVRPYVVVFAVDVAVSEGGARISGKSEAELRASIRLRDAQGRVYSPVPSAEVSPDMTNLLGTMQPSLASMMGKLGESFRAYVFPARDAEGRPIADPLTGGRFAVEIGESVFAWELPLAALLAPRTCPIDSAQFSGAFRYCPLHGVELLNADGAPARAPVSAARDRSPAP